MNNKKHHILIVAGVFLVMGVALLATVLYIGYMDWSELKDSTIAYNEARKKEEERIGLSNLLRTTATDREALAVYVVKRSDIVNYLETLERAAVHASLESEVRNVEEHKNKTGELELVTSLKVRGSFADIVSLIERFEVLPFTASVTEISLQYEKGNTWGAVLKLVSPAYINDEEVFDPKI
ncbi:MAG: hypothetical protein Q8P07_02895 [bacterium]|nr:hypothetical protein [bacterium]